MTPNTTVSISRGERVEDGYGDTQDVPHVIETNVPAFLSVVPSNDASSSNKVRIRIASRFHVQSTDIIKDSRDGVSYRVVTISRSSLVGGGSVINGVQLSN